MFYYVKDGDSIQKYRVTYDKEQLEKLRVEIINNCSEIKHLEYTATDGPTYHDDILQIRNLEIIKVGKTDNNDFYSQERDLYHYSYDKYDFPYLVTLINLLLGQHNVHALYTILNPDYKMEKEPFDKRIEELNNMINSISNCETSKKMELLEKLEQLISQSKLNINQKPVNEYYEKVQSNISLELMDTLKVSEIEKVEGFLSIVIDSVPIF